MRTLFIALLVLLVGVGVLRQQQYPMPTDSPSDREFPQRAAQKESLRARSSRDNLAVPDITVSIRERLARVIGELARATNSFEYRASRLQETVDGIATNDFPAAFAHLVELQGSGPTDAGRELQLRLLQRWAEIDIRAATEALAGFSATDRSEACERVAAVCARQNVEEAIAWAQRLPEDAARQSALLAIAHEVASQNPAQALMLASQTIVPAEKQSIVTQAASTWAVTSPEAAAAWAGQIRDSSLREQTLAAIATSWANNDPLAAAQFILDSLPEGPIQDNAVMGIMQRLASRDADAASAWVAQFPERLRDNAVAEMNRISELRRSLAR
jgi:hypothetical protein